MPPQRTEIDGREWRFPAARAPSGVERITFDARRHHQQSGAIGYCRGKHSKMGEDLLIGPVQIFHDEQDRAISAGVPGERCGEREFAAIASTVVHRVVKCAPFTGLGKGEKVVEEHERLRRDDPLSDQTFRRAASFLRIGNGRHAEQTP